MPDIAGRTSENVGVAAVVGRGIRGNNGRTWELDIRIVDGESLGDFVRRAGGESAVVHDSEQRVVAVGSVSLGRPAASGVSKDVSAVARRLRSTSSTALASSRSRRGELTHSRGPVALVNLEVVGHTSDSAVEGELSSLLRWRSILRSFCRSFQQTASDRGFVSVIGYSSPPDSIA